MKDYAAIHLATLTQIGGDKDDRKSTAGYIFMIGGAPISWCSIKEIMVALSSFEVVCISTSLSVFQAYGTKTSLHMEK